MLPVPAGGGFVFVLNDGGYWLLLSSKIKGKLLVTSATSAKKCKKLINLFIQTKPQTEV